MPTLAVVRPSLAALVVCVVVAAGCRPGPADRPTPPPPAVTVTVPVPRSVQSYLEYNGYLEAVESVQITARVKGFLNEVNFHEGDEVKQGDLLYKIDPREYDAAVKKADADRLKAAAELKRARSDAERAARMIATRAMSEEEYQQRIAARETAEAVLKQTEAAVEAAKLELSFTEIHAPISGRISRTLVTRGNLVGQMEATLLTTIVSVDPMYIYFDAPERDLVEYQRMRLENSGGNVTVEVGCGVEDGFPHRGKLDFQENRVETSTGTVRMRGTLANPGLSSGNVRRLYPGLFARVRVPDGEPKERLSLPEDALLTGQEGRFVYVVGADNVVQKRTVTVGPVVWRTRSGEESAPGWSLVKDEATRQPVASVVAVLSGLKSGDRVVVNGLTRARPGAPVAPDEWRLEAPK